ncbi:MAG: Flagellar hook-basal body complex protein fliE [Candidatus Magnetoglobus multicellularis str. Araruama]|uniref:Flagellar hook-basal body complex protein FliE n=1 Tax=Candidatus Magnetoglobus multicellularis str. Araruama TaxID=890399 RepID=A0A1V1PH04_9BACT|nr:MAG: Flagellar hook-basal body complex protein fliE [Candidatus Magnetoglobus multicellularis str. Araruama]
MNDIAIQSDSMFPLFPESKISQNQNNVDFQEFVKNAIYRTDQRQKDADIAIQKMMQGDAGIHETMLEMSKADVSLRMLNQFRTKTMESYKQIMQMTF